MTELIRVLLVDDHTMFRKGLASLIASRDDMDVVGEASDGFEALQKARELMPDLILMDLKMPRCDGLQATKLIKEEMPYIKIVVLTVSEEEEDVFEAIKYGAQGYLLKNMSPEIVFESIREASKGNAPIAPAVAIRILQEFQRHSQEKFQIHSPIASLTEREKEILHLVVEGASNQEIASRLVIAPGTVKNHLHNILAKLQLKNRTQAVAYAMQEGFIRPPPEKP